MLFSTPLFLFLFLPLVVACYLLAPNRYRNSVALAARAFFYAWGEPRFIAVVLLSSVLDWCLGRGIAGTKSERTRKGLVSLGVLSNLAILVYFKYMEFFVESANTMLSRLGASTFPALTILLPIGVSFIVFEKITYLVDLYRRTGKPAQTLQSYLLYVLFFPKLLAGPIVKYHEIAEQIVTRKLTAQEFEIGLTRFTFGLAKKVLIADVLARSADQIFGLTQDQLQPSMAWLGLFCFTLQIYFDFSGYSDMAIGMARMLGFRLRENFDIPYISTSFTEFWRRWHISLSTWIREYLYLPLGGNRVSVARSYFNLCFCFLLSGLWHGASWVFVIWGLYHGLFLVLDKLFWLKAQDRVPRPVRTLTTFLLVMGGWAIFRANSLTHAQAFLSSLFGATGKAPQYVYIGTDTMLLCAVGTAICVFPLIGSYWKQANRVRDLLEQPSLRLALTLVLLVVSFARVANASFNPFLYFRF